MFLCLECTPPAARWRHEIVFGISHGPCECCGEIHDCIDYGGRLEAHECVYYRGLHDNCNHQWDGPRIQVNQSASVATCSRCGSPALDLSETK